MAEVVLKCGKCGSKNLQVEKNPKDNSTVTCGGCGATGRYADVMREGMTQAKKAVERELGKLFKR